MARYEAQMGDVFKALGDPTRRAVVERLAAGPAATTELAEQFEMALPSFLQHLKTLEESGLVVSTKKGRVRTYWLKPDRLETARAWLTRQGEVWETRLDQLDSHIKTIEESKSD